MGFWSGHRERIKYVVYVRIVDDLKVGEAVCRHKCGLRLSGNFYLIIPRKLGTDCKTSYCKFLALLNKFCAILSHRNGRATVINGTKQTFKGRLRRLQIRYFPA